MFVLVSDFEETKAHILVKRMFNQWKSNECEENMYCPLSKNTFYYTLSTDELFSYLKIAELFSLTAEK